jgi:hypothetical protein
MKQTNNNMETTLTGPQKVIFKFTVKFHIQHGMTEEQAIQMGWDKVADMKKMAKSLRHERFQS